MNFSEIPVTGVLSHFIKGFWKFENVEGALTYDILPDGFFDLVLEIRQGVLWEVSLTGVWTRQIAVHIPEDSVLIGIQCKLIASEYIFQKPVTSFLNRKIVLPIDFLGVDKLPVDDFSAFADAFSQQTLHGLKNLEEIDHRKFDLFKTLYECKGEISVAQLSDKIHWSSRQMNRYFTRQFGLSIKNFSSILKCHASYPQIAKGNLYPGREYFDQSHFIKQIKRYTGVTPKVLCKNQNDRYLQFSTLKEN
ncbi:helix-turn-helix transcriptional regulator [Fulvivirga sp. M361]|uniref:helix-turn-helix domain-containing protein n=1 Tax=Fulvivirga sp. M361 TaxID=2594266 RepID=UPI00117BC950|nr:AraC family transcriptional regulator [Fulvivirga sp. M361]TRX52055.1 helix-turn-helix transcriptional regulator [Fulvivirga sp. M361]